MNNSINIFLNNKVHATQNWITKKHPSDLSVKFGDWCLTPVRYLFNGNTVYIDYQDNHVKYVSSGDLIEFTPQKTVWRVVASIIFLIPGLIIGSAFKGLGYLSSSIYERHQLIVRHYTPIDYTLGSKEQRLSLREVQEQVSQILNTRHKHHQPFVGNVIIYAEEGTQIKKIGIGCSLKPQKLILIGAQLASPTPDDERFLGSWEYEGPTAYEKFDALPIQRRVQSLEAALQDIPPQTVFSSFLSPRHFRRIYLVSEA